MKKIFSLLVLGVLLSQTTYSQKVAGTLKGIIRDSASATPLADATVSVITLPDSSLTSFTLSGASGSFEIKNLAAGEYLMMVSYTGLVPSSRKFSISAAAPVADLGLVNMDRHNRMLEEVVITEAPVKINGDTIAYRADAFKTKPNATVEDLLKKLPGVQVERDGTVKAQGETVQKVYVDGKEFFNNDPKLATQNLTADMVDQVEVYDDMSEQAKFSKIDDGSRSKAINLKLKKDKKKGMFGKAYAGAGNKERWEMGLTANIFKGATQTSIIARNNNTNNMGFTFSDMMGMFGSGGIGSMMGGGGNMIRGMSMSMPSMGGGGSTGFGGSSNGITKSSQVGLNYRDTWSKQMEVNGSYSFNHVNVDNNRNSVRRTLFPDSTMLKSGNTISKVENDNHRASLNLIYTLDSFSSLIYTPTFSYQKSYNTFSIDSFSTEVLKGNNSYRANNSLTRSASEGDGYNWNNNLIYRRKFRKPGRTFSLNLSNTLGNSDRNSLIDVASALYNPNGDIIRNIQTNNLNTFENETRNYGASVSYTEPWGRDKIVEINYSHNNNSNTSLREIQAKNLGTGKMEVLDSNNFRNHNVMNRAGANVRVVKKKYNYQVGGSVQFTTLNSENLFKGTTIEQKFTNFFPTASFTYNFARSRSFRFNYRGSTRQPSTSQLQDIVDTTSFPNIYQGNPNLGQEFVNNFNLSYNFFDIIKFRNLFVSLNFSNTMNKITNSIRQLPGGIQYTRPVNLDGAYSLTGAVNLGFPIKKLKGGNFNTNTRVTLLRDVNLLNDEVNYSRNLIVGEDLRLSYNWKEKLDLGVGVSTNYTQVTYTNQQQARNNTKFFTHNFSADFNYRLPWGFIIASDFYYTMNTGREDGFNQNFALLNGSLAKELFKSKRGEIKFSMFDILNKNQGISRTAEMNYIEDIQNLVLNRYFLVTFTYRLNKMGGAKVPPVIERATRNIRIN